ncbi:nucleotidyltransferase family protein [Pelomonas sp. V22]|uniref:nucleotidyltransferase family protein n=1 Tax=Pelomonas sp. V22 TaxID=2822139 RepID=UPI0024A7E0ED|nr:nucleotidyltransferase family protein [Pelomonas sp. V22]MDI4634992.1 nucleotidyltransferase family protein [Pelomonas sp. V22]
MSVHEERLRALALQSPWLMEGLRAARSLGLSSWCIGAGAVRNLVWDSLHGRSGRPELADVDLVYFDAHSMQAGSEQALQQRLQAVCPELPWEVCNQARVHLWFEAHFGHAVAPLQSLEESVACWPEYATAVGLWLDERDEIQVIAPHGLDDLFGCVVRRNPQRVSSETYRQRLAQKRYAERWPQVRVHPA